MLGVVEDARMPLWELLTSPDITPEAAFARLIAGALAGAVIGLEREWSRQTAGLRTHVLICLGSTLLMSLSLYMAEGFGGEGGDPGRIAAQVVSGIGFLGAGAFIRIGSDMKGVTTAASIWVVAAIGLAIGAGWMMPAVVALGVAFLSLTILERVERRFFPAARYKTLRIDYDVGTPDRRRLERILKESGISIQTYDAQQSIAKKTTTLTLLLKVPVRLEAEPLFKEIKTTGRVVKIKLQETL
jgi:putative Mg2+ transporter-C (MgtC) family protein